MGIPERFTNFISQQLELDADNESIILYSSRIIYSTLFSFFSIMIFAYFLGVLKYAVLAALTNMIIRQYAGGAHASAPYRCAIIAALVFGGLGLATKYIPWPDMPFILVFYLLSGFLGLCLIWRFAPADTVNKSINPNDISRFKRKAILVWFLWFLFFVIVAFDFVKINHMFLIASTLGLLWESCTLTPIGYRFIAILDGYLTWLPVKGGNIS